MEARIASQRIPGTSEMLSRYGLQRIYDEKKKGFTASKIGTWEEHKETIRKMMKASEWAFDRTKEAFELVAQDETEKMHCSEARTTCGVSSRQLQGGVTSQCHTCAQTASVSLWKTTFGGPLGENHKVVVRNLWRKVRLDATTQAVGRANWRKF